MLQAIIKSWLAKFRGPQPIVKPPEPKRPYTVKAPFDIHHGEVRFYNGKLYTKRSGLWYYDKKARGCAYYPEGPEPKQVSEDGGVELPNEVSHYWELP